MNSFSSVFIVLCGGKENIQSKSIILDLFHEGYTTEMERIYEPSRVGKYTLLFGCYAVDENCSSAIFIKNSKHLKPKIGQTFVAYFFDPITDFGINLRKDRKTICARHDICAKFPVYS